LTVATILIIFVPIFYYAIETLRERKSPNQTGDAAPEDHPEATDSSAEPQET
jgi:hypothetical protein